MPTETYKVTDISQMIELCGPEVTPPFTLKCLIQSRNQTPFYIFFTTRTALDEEPIDDSQLNNIESGIYQLDINIETQDSFYAIIKSDIPCDVDIIAEIVTKPDNTPETTKLADPDTMEDKPEKQPTKKINILIKTIIAMIVIGVAIYFLYQYLKKTGKINISSSVIPRITEHTHKSPSDMSDQQSDTSSQLMSPNGHLSANANMDLIHRLKSMNIPL
jgi:hypothetical protein